MAPQNKIEKKTRGRKRKARTEVSSDSDSSSLSPESDLSDAEVTKVPRTKSSKPTKSASKSSTKRISPPAAALQQPEPSPSTILPSPAPEVPSAPTSQAPVNSQWYLQQATKEFGKDLLALRDSKDFVPGVSEGLIIRALEGMGSRA